MPLFTKVATLSYNLGIILWYPFGGLTLIFVYVLAAQTPAGQAGPRFKTVCLIRDMLRRSGYYFKTYFFKHKALKFKILH